MFLANICVQTESLLHSLEQSARSIGLHENVNKTEFISFKQDRAISTLNDLVSVFYGISIYIRWKAFDIRRLVPIPR